MFAPRLLLLGTVLLACVLAQYTPLDPSGNPFKGRSYYVNPSLQVNIDFSLATSVDSLERANLMVMRNSASAYWLDVKTKAPQARAILQDAASRSPAQLVLFIIYDLPNRDCHAKASNGEICCYYNADRTCDYLRQGDCAEGIREYSKEYIDPLVEVFAEFQDRVPIVVVLEPDSLPNLSTNLDDPRCSNPATQAAYKLGVSYAVNTIASRAPKVVQYLDAGHGGWLGWENNIKSFGQTVRSLNILSRLRGFATNVANYQPLGQLCPQVGFCLNGMNPNHPCCADPCKLASQFNLANNELNYAAVLAREFGPSIRVIIDTGRNGVSNMRSDCGNWCNPRGAGAGIIPTANTAFPQVVDAYYWLKTPGESDGCSEILPNGRRCPRFDVSCNSVDSLGSRSTEPRVPEAGGWYDFQVKMLARNANYGEVPPSATGNPPSSVSPSQPPVTTAQPPATTTAAPATTTAAPVTTTAAPVTTAPSPAPTSQAPATTASPTGEPCSKIWGQCGGRNHRGPTCCEPGLTCRQYSDWYSQCIRP